jgi:hypothetical protein
VRQRDAHAWVEYLQDGYWHMFDPTAAIAPERILQGLEQALSQPERDLLAGWQPSWMQQMALQWSHLDYLWSVWVLGFNQQQQAELWLMLQSWLDYWRWLLGVMVGIGISLLLWLLYWQQQRRQLMRLAPDYWRRRVFAELPEPDQPGESVHSWLKKLAQVNPDAAVPLQQLAASYERVVFAAKPEAASALQQQLRQQRKKLRALKRP